MKYVTRRTTHDKILHDTEFNIAKITKYDGPWLKGSCFNDLILFQKRKTSGSGTKNEKFQKKN